VIGGPGHRSVISPIPAYSLTALVPDTAASLSGRDRQTASTSPPGALSLNLKHISPSMKHATWRRLSKLRDRLRSGSVSDETHDQFSPEEAAPLCGRQVLAYT
jgi:hypothetical protein